MKSHLHHFLTLFLVGIYSRAAGVYQVLGDLVCLKSLFILFVFVEDVAFLLEFISLDQIILKLFNVLDNSYTKALS